MKVYYYYFLFLFHSHGQMFLSRCHEIATICAAEESIDRDETRVGEIIIDRIVNGQMVYRWLSIQIPVHTFPCSIYIDREEQVHICEENIACKV